MAASCPARAVKGRYTIFLNSLAPEYFVPITAYSCVRRRRSCLVSTTHRFPLSFLPHPRRARSGVLMRWAVVQVPCRSATTPGTLHYGLNRAKPQTGRSPADCCSRATSLCRKAVPYLEGTSRWLSLVAFRARSCSNTWQVWIYLLIYW